MKKIYIFSLSGVVYAIDEDGVNWLTSAAYGFIYESRDFKENFLSEKFKEYTKKFETDYIVIHVISENDKDDLVHVIEGFIDRRGSVCPDSSEVSFWKNEVFEIRSSYFDSYNKNIWDKINGLR